MTRPKTRSKTLHCDVVRSLPDVGARFDRRVAIVIPAHNEARHIADVIARCVALAPTCVLVIDDCSSDGTADVLAACSALHRRRHPGVVRWTRNSQNLGKQGAVRRGLAELLATFGVDGLDAVALIDGDGQHDPAELPALAALLSAPRARDRAALPAYALVHGYDVIIGARAHDEMPVQRRVSNWLVNTGFRVIAGIDLVDVQSGLRIYSAELAAVLAERLGDHGGYGLEHESLSVLASYGREARRTVRIAAAPASCGYGVAESGIGPDEVVNLAVATVQQAMRIRRTRRHSGAHALSSRRGAR
ncbi:MAG: glycosyltransferase family 2 protein [Myxococcales bacterium]|nr:glycosyltransferase family 2 protein [Myxococcales bacterium]